MQPRGRTGAVLDRGVAAGASDAPAESYIDGLSLEGRLAGWRGGDLDDFIGGRYGGAATFQGRWFGAPAAVKVMFPGEGHQDPARVVEMAVLSSVRHPNVVALYACLPDVVAEGGAGGGGRGKGPGGPLRFRHMMSHEAGDDVSGGVVTTVPSACDVLVTEFCDRGALAAALDSGALFGAAPSKAAAAAASAVLLDVALALRYLHSINLTHGNVTAEAVLLKTEATRPAGFVAKLAKFGHCQIHGRDGRPLALDVLPPGGGAPGSVRVAPRERAGGASPADDVCAFGALVTEVFEAAAAASGAPAPPPHWARALAAMCGAPDAGGRPGMDAVVRALDCVARPPA